MKLRHMAADVLLGSVPQHVQFGFVGTNDDAFAADDMQPHGTVLEKVLQILRCPADFLLNPLASGDVLEAIDGALDSARVVAQGADIDQGCNARAVRPRHDYFGIARGSTDAKSGGHRTVGMRKRRSIEQIELMGAAETLLLGEIRCSSPQLDGLGIVGDEGSLGLTEVNRTGNGIESGATGSDQRLELRRLTTKGERKFFDIRHWKLLSGRETEVPVRTGSSKKADAPVGPPNLPQRPRGATVPKCRHW